MIKQIFIFFIIASIMYDYVVNAKEVLRIVKNKRQTYGGLQGDFKPDWLNGASNNNLFSGGFSGFHNGGTSKFGPVNIIGNPYGNSYYNPGKASLNLGLKKGPVTFQPAQQQPIKIQAAQSVNNYGGESYAQPQHQQLTYYPSHTTYTTPSLSGNIKHNSIMSAFSGLHLNGNQDMVPIYATGIKGLGHYAAPQFQHETPSIPSYAHNFGFQAVTKPDSDNDKKTFSLYQNPNHVIPSYTVPSSFSNFSPDKSNINNAYYSGGLTQSSLGGHNKIQQAYTIPNPSILSSLPNNFYQQGATSDATYANPNVSYGKSYGYQDLGHSQAQNYNTISYSVPSH